MQLLNVASKGRIIRLLIATTFAGFVVAYGVTRFGLTDRVGSFSDLTLDHLVVSAVVDGEDPYQGIDVLAQRYGVGLPDLGQPELGGAGRIHPRPPGAILLLFPLVLLQAESLHGFSLVVNCLAAVAFLYAGAAATSIKAEWLLLGAPLLMLAHPVISAFEFASQSLVIAALVAFAVGVLWRRDSTVGGVALGLAITLKLWPALLLIPLLKYARRRGVLSALVVSGGLNLAGCLVFGISPIEAWQGLTSAGESWAGFPGNGSLAGQFVEMGATLPLATLLTVLVLLPIALVLWDRRVDLKVMLWATVLLAILASPLSWVHYNIALIPLAMILAIRSQGWDEATRWGLLGWALLTWGGRYVRLVIDGQVELAGTLAFTERALLLVAVIQVVLRLIRQPGVPKHQSSERFEPAEVLPS